MTKGRRVILPLSLAILLLSPPVRAAEWFSEVTLQVPGNPTVVFATDLDNDGLEDVAVLYAVSEATRLRYYFHIAAFLQGAEGFPTKPTLTAPLAGSEAIAFLAETDPSRPGKELVLMGGGRVARWGVARKRGQTRWVPEILFAGGSDWLARDWRGIRHVDLARDLDGDGLSEILLPGRASMAILAGGKDGQYTVRDQIETEVYREMGQPQDPGHIIDFIDRYALKISEILPEIYDVDVNGDGRRDLVLTYGDLVATYRQEEDGSFENSPTLFRSGLTPNRDVLRSAVPPKIITTQARDFDGDSRADLIISRSEVRGIKGIVTIEVHRNVNGTFETKPSFRLKKNVLALWPIVGDYDHDGKLDFTFLQTEFGIREIIRFLITKRVKFHFDFYLWRGTPAFPPKPFRRKDVSMKFDLKEGHLSGLPMVDISHDFNGDGLADFYTPHERDAFSIYFARKPGNSELFNGGADINMKVHQSYYRQFSDLNQDGRADIIFWYQSEFLRKDLNDKILLLISKPDPPR